MHLASFSSGKRNSKENSIGFFSRNNTLMFLTTGAIWLVLFLYQFGLGRAISKYVDRFKIRPSTIDGLAMAILGIAMMLNLFALPSPAFTIQLVLGLSGTVVLAVAAEVFRTPADKQRRPAWYVGEGKPTWQPIATSNQGNLRFSMHSVAVFATAFCIGLGIAAPRWNAYRLAQKQQATAMNRILELGGKVQQQNVVLSGTKVTDDDLGLLTHLNRIKYLNLNLGATDISNEGMKHIAQLPTLRILRVSGTNIDDAGLERLRDSKKIAMLNCRLTSVTGTGLSEQWTDLKQIDLSLCPVSREGIERAAIYPDLVYLSLQQTDVDDSMIDVLAKLHTKVLDLSETNVTQTGIKRLKSMATGIETIRWRQKRAPPNLP